MELGFDAQVPLADDPGDVAALPEQLGPRNRVGRKAGPVVGLLGRNPIRDSQLRAEAAGEERSPAGRADRRASERVEEAGAFAGQPIHVGRARLAGTVGPDGPDSLIVGDNRDEVARRGFRGPSRRGHDERNQGDDEAMRRRKHDPKLRKQFHSEDESTVCAVKTRLAATGTSCQHYQRRAGVSPARPSEARPWWCESRAFRRGWAGETPALLSRRDLDRCGTSEMRPSTALSTLNSQLWTSLNFRVPLLPARAAAVSSRDHRRNRQVCRPKQSPGGTGQAP